MNTRHKFILKRFGLMLISLYMIITVLFFLFRIMPGNPAAQVVTMSMTQADRAALRAQYGLDQPLTVQYILYIKNFAQGDLGISFFTNRPVLPHVLNKSLNTLSIALPSVIISFTIGPLLGAYLASRRNEPVDDILSGTMLIAYAAPVFWSGMLAIMLFSFTLNWLPSSGMHSATYNPTTLTGRFLSWDFVRHAILPIAVFSAWWLSIPTLIMRNNVIDILNSDFIQLNRAEGVSDFRILYKHAVRNALLPVLHRAALAFGLAFGGSVIIETVFSWPGLGQSMWFATLRQDYPMAQGAFLLIATMVIVMNFIVDIISAYVDPRVASGEEVET